MCDSIADGGQRCPSGALKRYHARRMAYEVLSEQALKARDLNGRIPTEVTRKRDEAYEEFLIARVEYASTPAGEAAMLAQQAQYGPDDYEALELGDVIRKGREMRERNAAIKAAVRAGKPVPMPQPEPEWPDYSNRYTELNAAYEHLDEAASWGNGPTMTQGALATFFEDQMELSEPEANGLARAVLDRYEEYTDDLAERRASGW